MDINTDNHTSWNIFSFETGQQFYIVSTPIIIKRGDTHRSLLVTTVQTDPQDLIELRNG